jgi:hypothetical protein
MNRPEIIGFPHPHAVSRFELIAELRRQKRAEIARVIELAARLAARFGAETAVGFLYYEILGRPPGRETLLAYAEQIRHARATVASIAEEFLVLGHSDLGITATSGSGPDRPAE